MALFNAETSVFNLVKFSKQHPEFNIEGYADHLEPEDKVEITEYAPKFFRAIRKNIVSEEVFMQTFIPNKNMEGIYNFQPGSGKSPSFFFFPDNRLLMLKTLKNSEKQILFENGFLLDYFKHVMKNPDTLLMKILGVYEMKVGLTPPVTFILTENMIALDQKRVKCCFDLKGSLYGRETKVSDEDLMKGTGMKVLKDQNMIHINELIA